MSFNVGDHVERFQGGENEGMYQGDTGTVTRMNGASIYVKRDKDGYECGEHSSENFRLTTKSNNNSMNLLQSFTNLFLKEPEKSFRKAGITGDDGTLTDDGQKVFLTWLLAKNGEAFNTEVVAPILAEQDADKK